MKNWSLCPPQDRHLRINGNHKSQNPNNKQIPMTEIVRDSLGLPTLRANPQFQNSKPVWVI